MVYNSKHLFLHTLHENDGQYECNSNELYAAWLGSAQLFHFGRQVKRVTTIWDMLFWWWSCKAKGTEPHCACTFCPIPFVNTRVSGEKNLPTISKQHEKGLVRTGKNKRADERMLLSTNVLRESRLLFIKFSPLE